MKALLGFGLSLGLLVAALAPAVAADPVLLYASKDIKVGTVDFSGGGATLKVTIDLDDGWCMTAAHVDQAMSAADLPTNKAGNPLVGRFDKSRTYDPCVETDSFEFAVNDGSVFAVHANVVKHGPFWAIENIDEDQGLRKDGSAVPSARSDPQKALVQDYVANGAIKFFSLGKDGKIEVGFGCKVLNGDGNDLKIWEVTNGTYPSETALVKVSQDGITWALLGTADNAGSGANRSSAFDAGLLPWFRYVQLVDTTDFTATFPGDPADGFDVDGVEALQDCNSESAWGGVTKFGGGSWATYIMYEG
jgi:hypothetical protein